MFYICYIGDLQRVQAKIKQRNWGRKKHLCNKRRCSLEPAAREKIYTGEFCTEKNSKKGIDRKTTRGFKKLSRFFFITPNRLALLTAVFGNQKLAETSPGTPHTAPGATLQQGTLLTGGNRAGPLARDLLQRRPTGNSFEQHIGKPLVKNTRHRISSGMTQQTGIQDPGCGQVGVADEGAARRRTV
jgi:hypothetical protein